MWVDLRKLQKFITHQMHNMEAITASNHHYELQLSRINVSIAARAKTRRQLMDQMHRSQTLTGGGRTVNQLQPSRARIW